MALRISPFAQSPPSMRNVVAPYNPLLQSGTSVLTIGTVYGTRVVVSEDGILNDLALFHGVSSGNHRLGIYDTGDTTYGVRTLLHDSGSIAANGNATSWQTLSDPALAVTAGQELDFVFMADNTTITVGKIALAGSPQVQLAAGYLPVPGGVAPKLAWSYAAGAYAAFPATLAEANCQTAGGLVVGCPIARLTK